MANVTVSARQARATWFKDFDPVEDYDRMRDLLAKCLESGSIAERIMGNLLSGLPINPECRDAMRNAGIKIAR